MYIQMQTNKPASDVWILYTITQLMWTKIGFPIGEWVSTRPKLLNWDHRFQLDYLTAMPYCRWWISNQAGFPNGRLSGTIVGQQTYRVNPLFSELCACSELRKQWKFTRYVCCRLVLESLLLGQSPSRRIRTTNSKSIFNGNWTLDLPHSRSKSTTVRSMLQERGLDCWWWNIETDYDKKIIVLAWAT